MKIGFIGLGNMASAMIGGILKKNLYSPEDLIGADKSEEAVKRAAETFHIHTTTDNIEVAEAADVLILAVKPQFFEGMIAEIKGAVGEDAVILQTDVQPHVGHAEAEAHVERLFVDQMGMRHVAQGEHPGTVEVAVLEQHATGARVADVEHHVDGAVGFRIVLEERNLGGRPGE